MAIKINTKCILGILAVGILAAVPVWAGSDIIEVDAGEEFVITLDSNPASGYRWELAEAPDETMLEFIRSRYIADRNTDDRIGAGGKEIWTFMGLEAGETEILLEYVRPWEKNIPPAEEKKFSVVIY
ncbi:MAG: protease inhibitor I42 family protein [Candidatus Omnitrophota bacterium]